MKSLLQRPSLPDVTIRIVIAKPGLDGHDRSAKVIVRSLCDADHEDIYTGPHQTPAQIIACAIQEDASVISPSMLSGAHLTTRDVITLLAKHDAAGVRVIVDGITPDADVRVLQAMGVQAVFTPDADLGWIIEAAAQASTDMAGTEADRS